MFNLIKKDFLTISRDRSELLVLMVMPLVLTTILGFALGGLMSGEEGMRKIPIAIVQENDFESDIEAFEERLTQEGIPDEIITQMLMSAQEADPASILLNIIESPDFEDLFDIRKDLSKDQAQNAIRSDEVNAIITIPQDFSYNTLMAIYLDEEPNAALELFVPDTEGLRGGIVENILISFTEQYNLEIALAQATQGEIIDSQVEDLGETTNLSIYNPVTSFQYYTMGISVMFALYVASTISSNAFKEKTSHVFARLMLTGEKPLGYLLSKGISATVLTFVQLSILFIVSSLVFQTFSGLSRESLVSMGVVTLIYSLTVGSLATLLTAIALQFNSDSVSGIFASFLVSAFAFMGGSMIPVEQFSPFLSQLGNWTPNGAMMTAYLQLIQGFSLNSVLPMIYRVLAMMIVFIIIALAIFPKRRLI